nr:MAG TPA: hypothetical protein [Caudoviricetes sp.]DAY73305.1 MAG TPA: hypothetical protein [Caudoviricetes sp.]
MFLVSASAGFDTCNRFRTSALKPFLFNVWFGYHITVFLRLLPPQCKFLSSSTTERECLLTIRISQLCAYVFRSAFIT